MELIKLTFVVKLRRWTALINGKTHSCNECLETLAAIQLMAGQWAAVLH